MAIGTPPTEFVPRQRPPMSARHPFAMTEGMQGMLDRFKAGVAEPFVGLTTDGRVQPGLFSIGRGTVRRLPGEATLPAERPADTGAR